MNRSRLETVQAMFDAFNRDRVDDEVIENLFVPDVELVDFPEIPGRREYRGYDGMRAFMSDLAQNWRTTEVAVEEIREVDGKVIVLGTQTAIGAVTDVPVASSFGEVVEFEGDRIDRIRMFRDHAQALEAAGAQAR